MYGRRKEESVGSSSSSDELGMCASYDSGGALTVLDFEDIDLGKGQRPTDLVGDTLDLYLVTFLGRTLVGDMNVDTDTSLLAQVPRSNSHTAHPVYDGGRNRAMDASF